MKIAVELQPILKKKTGVGWYAYHLVQELSKRNVELNGKVFNFLGRNNLTQSLQDITIDIETCKLMPYGVYSRLWDMIPISYNLLFSKKADIYHFFNFVFPPRINGKIIVTVHDMVYKKYPHTLTKANLRRLNSNLLRVCQRADIIITVSESSKKDIINYLDVSEEKVFIVPPAVDKNKFRPDYSYDEINTAKKKYEITTDDYYLYLGTLEPRKNIESIIEAYALLLKNLNSKQIPKLIIAGGKGWLYQGLFNLVQELKLENQVHFPGYILDEDVPKLINGATAFVFPSFYEGFGMPPLEAMSCGVPVIASNTSSLPEVIEDAGILIDPYSIEELTGAMEQILRNPQLRNIMVSKGLLQAKKFTWEKSAELTIEIYKKVYSRGENENSN